ncbi:MAG: hypothetical protein IKF70_03335, partial [Firmicutes bacterium]|nr:hypothetical protein [Bacillota bacterium]
LKYLIVFLAILGVSYLAVMWIGGNGAGAFLARLAISVLVPNLLMFLIYRKTDEFGFMITQVRKTVFRK